jgi:hypothetical protein
MRLALLFLIFLMAPAFAQETSDDAAQVYGIWRAEPGNPKRAATIEFTRDEDLSYGFSCWKGHWLFFFNYQAPEGGMCGDHEECENDVSEVDLNFQIANRPDVSDQFTLFENYYFQDENLSVLDIEAMIAAGRFRLNLDGKLKAVWQVDHIDFPLDGFEKAVTDNKKVFACALHEPVPVPPERPKQVATAKVKPEQVAATEIRKFDAKKHKVKKSKAARARAAKSKLPSHALKKSKKSKAQKAAHKKKRH